MILQVLMKHPTGSMLHHVQLYFLACSSRVLAAGMLQCAVHAQPIIKDIG
jgi:hypothetical protein